MSSMIGKFNYSEIAMPTAASMKQPETEPQGWLARCHRVGHVSCLCSRTVGMSTMHRPVT